MHTPSLRATFTASFVAAFGAAAAGYAFGNTTVFVAGLGLVAVVLAGGVAMSLPGNAPRDAEAPEPGHTPLAADTPREESPVEFDVVAPAHAREPAHPVVHVVEAPAEDHARYAPPAGWPQLDARAVEAPVAVPQRRYAPGFEPPGYRAEAPTRTPPAAWARPAVSQESRYSALGRGETRGVCSQCGAHLTLPSARPLRATCPSCGHSKMLR